ncbi:MAG: hypothetical protein M3Q91_02240 [Acidobacteriota bacterium]|nr:hypothetical protein [Acidobacteriota bacterium]
MNDGITQSLSARLVPSGTATMQNIVLWILRIGLAALYVGHGAFGIITKRAWLPYFAFVGISEPTAFKLMPLIGTLDIAMGILVLFLPIRGDRPIVAGN